MNRFIYTMRTKEKLGQTPPSNQNRQFTEDQFGNIPGGSSIQAGTGIAATDDRITGRTANPSTTTSTSNATAKPYTQQQLNDLINAAADAKLKTLLNQNKTASSIFTVLDPANDITTLENELVTGGIWSDGISNLTTYFSSSALTTTQRRYYLDVHQSTPTSAGSTVQFSVAYGHALGSGSDSQGQLNDSPSRAIYAQYRSLLLAPGDTRFTTLSGSTDSIYIINFKRSRLKERLDPGNFQLSLSGISTRAVNATGSVTVTTSSLVTLIDDSSLKTATVGESGKVYNIVSGSITSGVFNSTAPVYYGLAYPDHGVLVLDGNKLDQVLSFKTQVSASKECNNHFALFHSLSGSAIVVNQFGDNCGFLARNSEKITSKHFFIRVKNGQYNFSNNPTYISGSAGQINEPDFRNGNPKTYITTVGLYNDSAQLIAIAKLSKPLLKSFTREALIRVKLDF